MREAGEAEAMAARVLIGEMDGGEESVASTESEREASDGGGGEECDCCRSHVMTAKVGKSVSPSSVDGCPSV